jgi:hypothetical protein
MKLVKLVESLPIILRIVMLLLVIIVVVKIINLVVVLNARDVNNLVMNMKIVGTVFVVIVKNWDIK